MLFKINSQSGYNYFHEEMERNGDLPFYSLLEACKCLNFIVNLLNYFFFSDFPHFFNNSKVAFQFQIS